MTSPLDEPGPPPPRHSVAHRLRLPVASGKMHAFLVAMCFALSVVLIVPLIRRFPPWIDFEIVLGLWWIIWTVSLARLLYTATTVSDDHSLGAPRNWLGSLFSGKGKKKQAAVAPPSSGNGGDLVWGGLNILQVFGEAEGCAAVLIFLAVLGLAILGLWLLLEVVVPALAFVAYFMIRGMLARVANDAHNCEGHRLRSFGWAATWATLYTAPLAILVWLAHFLHAHKLV